jgi:glycosyltransferase involved in cell wall biosynthesis
LKVLHVAFSSSGGAGRTATLLKESQNKMGIKADSKVITNTGIPSVLSQHPNLVSRALIDFFLVRNTKSGPLFSLYRSNGVMRPEIDFKKSYEIFNFHWMPGVVDLLSPLPPNLAAIPQIWTLHDMWAFTGGCHHSDGCINFQTKCQSCPQVRGIYKNKVARSLEVKKRYFSNNQKIGVIAPSQWIYDVASSSSVLENIRLERIPNPINDEFFVQYDPQLIRKPLEITNDFVIGFSASNLEDEVKGFKQFIQLVNALSIARPNKQISILVIGNGKCPKSIGCFRVNQVSNLSDIKKIAECFAAMDIFVSTSSNETAPLVVSEALAVGLPIACFDSTGLSEMTNSGKNGALISSTSDFVDFINRLLFDTDLYRSYSQSAKMYAKEMHHSESVSQKYIDFYESFL